MTGIYLFLLLYLPLIKTPSPKNINGKLLIKTRLILIVRVLKYIRLHSFYILFILLLGSPGIFLKAVTLISWLMVFIQFVFQIVLIVIQPYGQVLEPICKLY